MNVVWEVGGAALGVGVLVGLGWALGFRPRGRLDRAMVVAALVHADSRAGLQDVVISADGATAIGLLRDGRWMLVRWMGDRPATTLADPAALRVARSPSRLIVRHPDVGQGPLRLTLADRVPEWLASRAA